MSVQEEDPGEAGRRMRDPSQPAQRIVEEVKPRAARSLIIPSLAVANLTIGMPMLIISLHLIDIARSFGVPVGVAAQASTAYFAVTVIVALLLGVLSVRFGHKQLILAGLFFVSVSALCCYFAQDLTTMLLVYSLSGLGTAIVTPMSGAMIGEHLPIERRGTAMGWIIAGMSSAYLIGSPVVSFLGNWRLGFLAFVLPVAVLSLFLAIIFLPSSQSKNQVSGGAGNYLKGFREIFRNRSAMACLLGASLVSASFTVLLNYGISFYRQRFLVSTSSASIILTVAALTYVSGSLVGGRLVNRVGRKPLTVLAAFLLGLSVVSFIFVANLWLSLVLNFLGCFSGGMRVTAGNNLALEQVPGFRGAMMSINQAAISTGQVIGNSSAGMILLLYGYETVGLSLGVLAIVAALVFLLLTIDPTKRSSPRIKVTSNA